MKKWKDLSQLEKTFLAIIAVLIVGIALRWSDVSEGIKRGFNRVDKLAPADSTVSTQPDTLLYSEGVVTMEGVFEPIRSFPTIKDTAAFIAELQRLYNLPKATSGRLTAYEKLRLYGSDNDYILLAYSYDDDMMASYPWKRQLLFSLDGRLVGMLDALRYELVEVFPNQRPLLLSLQVTAKGNGGHRIYKISPHGTLENVYEGYYGCAVQTYDAHEDGTTYQPSELRLVVADYSKDGMNDIAFTGCMVGEKDEAKKIPIELIFLYNKRTGHFEAKEPYDKLLEAHRKTLMGGDY